jgi:hypothetical protein
MSDFIASLRGKPQPFQTPSGLTVQLRPITIGERRDLFAWWESHKEDAGFGSALIGKYVSLGLIDGNGAQAVSERDVYSLPLSAVDFDAIGKEVAVRAGMWPEDSEKKAPSLSPS